MKKRMKALAAIALSVCMLAGCGSSQKPAAPAESSAGGGESQSPAAAETGGEEASAGDTDFSGVTLVFAQDLSTDETANALSEEIIKEWETKTGATVKFEKQPTDYRVWLTTQFTANQGPDVYTGIIYDITADYEAGYLHNFKDLYDQESPYDTGKAWKETLPDSILERMYLTDNDVPGYPSSTSVVRIFYNQSLFDAAGVQVPETWDQFMDVCQKLKSAGTTPFAFPNASKDDLSWLWFNNSVCSQLNNDLVEKTDVSGNGFIELNEMVKAFDEGTLDFTSDSIKDSFDLMKDFSQYWTSDYNGLDQKTAIDMFIRGEVAMVQAMSTNLTAISANVGDSFEYGVMAIPVITTDTNKNAMGKSVILGGQPDIIFAVNKACESDPKKLAAAIDFAQFMSSPDVQRRFAEGINRIPLSTSTQLPDRLSGFIITEEPLRLAYYTGVNSELRGEVAMVQAMSTNLTAISANVGDSFEYGVMAIPVITTDTNKNAMGKSVILGGQPDIIFAVNKACESDPKKLAAAIDFAQFMSSPDVQRRFAEGINRIPLSTSTQLPDRLSGFIITEEPLRLAYYTGVNSELRDFFCRGGQMYLEGTYDTDAFAQYVQDSFKTVFDTIKAEKEWSADNNYGLDTQ